MADATGPFTINRDDVAAKVIDGELILIRLSDGTYYSMEHAGALVWELIERGHDLPGLVHGVHASFDAPLERIAADVERLIAELLGDQLITPASEPVSAPAAPATPAQRLPYVPPRLDIYRDMGNLLALDPPTPGIDDLSFDDEREE